MSYIIAIDGPAGTGKGTVAKLLSKKFGMTNIDTGAMYRCVTLEMIRKKVKIEEQQKIEEILKNIHIDFKQSKEKELVFLNGEDVTQEIRTKEVTNLVSPVSAVKSIRISMVELQRKLGKEKDVVMEGRDIGTVVFPNADVKIYLDADIEERAKRRFLQNKEKNIDMPYEEILENIKKRDENDKNKEMGALKVAEDATVIDTTHLSIEQVVEKIEKIVLEVRNQK